VLDEKFKSINNLFEGYLKAGCISIQCRL